MVRLVDQNNAPCALHLAVRDATGESIVELQADSPEWWSFGVVTVLHTPDGRFCGTQFPSLANAMSHLESYYPTVLRLLRLDRGQARLHHTVHRIVYAWCYHKLHALVARG